MPKIKAGMSDSAEGDMTSMIDMTFQLIAFFMVLINFADEASNKDVKIPSSTLAVPPKTPPKDPVLIQIDREGKVQYSGGDPDEFAVVRPKLESKATVLKNESEDALKNAHVIIRADHRTEAGKVQDVIDYCQLLGFESFTFRATAISREKPG